MIAEMFVAAARAAVRPLFERSLPVGARIESAVEAACTAADCNTSLGILLLCAPIAVACEQPAVTESVAALRRAVDDVLARLNVEDARAAYRAIARANPGGLGRTSEQDVHEVPTIDLRAAMRLAADRDRIALQYANGYADIFDVGLPVFERDARTSVRAGVLATYLTFLASGPDSHVLRKLGADVARAMVDEARHRLAALTPASADTLVAAWDDDLKRRGINPGTSADLTVATAFVAACVNPTLMAESLR
jgi:triphosphoribosyl-dephospho-CoA synthase